MLLDQPRGDDPDHPGVPALSGEHDRGGIGLFEFPQRRLRLVLDRALYLAPLAVDPAELGRDFGGPLLRIGQKELDPGVGPVHPPGGVDAWTQAKTEVAGREPCGVHA